MEIQATELIKDLRYQNIVCDTISEIWRQRQSRPKPKDGYKYKIDGIDLLNSQGNLNRLYFLNCILDIWNKTSNIPRRERMVIETVCTNSATEYFKIINK